MIIELEYSNPEISILLPVYNGEKTLRTTLQSLLDQTFQNFEVLVGIDGTYDDSKEIAESFKDSRIKIFLNSSNLGLAKNVNKLILNANASSKYLAMAEQDDIYVPKRLQWQLDIMNQKPNVGIVSGIAEFVSDHRKVLFPGLLVDKKQFPQGEELIKFLYRYQLKVVNSCMMIRKSVHKNNEMNFKDTYGNYNVDWDYTLRMSLKTEVYGIPKVLVYMNRKSDNQSVTKDKWQQFKASRALLKDYYRTYPKTLSKLDYKMALKEHRKIELGYRNYIGIVLNALYYTLHYRDFYFLKYLGKKIKHYLNG